MAVYLILLIAVTVCGLVFCQRKTTRRRDLIFLLVFFGAMFALSVMRALTVGIDTQSYCQYYTGLASAGSDFLFSPDNLYRKEPGYTLLNLLLYRISPNPYMLLAGVAAVILILRAVFIWRYSSSVWLGVFVFVAYGFFNYSICTYRQEIAISIALFALPQLQKRKILPYMLLVALAATFHISLLVLVPIYFIANLPLNKITLSIYSLGTLFVLLFSEPLLTFFTTYVYKQYTLDNYFTGGRSVNTSFIPILTFIGALFLAKRLLERKPQNIVLLNFSAYAAFLFVLTLKHFVFQRIALIFLPAAILLLPELLASVRPNPADYPELVEYDSLDKAKQKQLLYKYTQVKKRFDDDHSAYMLTLGTVLTAGWIYYLFILLANRLLHIPYVFFFAQPPL